VVIEPAPGSRRSQFRGPDLGSSGPTISSKLPAASMSNSASLRVWPSFWLMPPPAVPSSTVNDV
jgi:hypothetical protein